MRPQQSASVCAVRRHKRRERLRDAISAYRTFGTPNPCRCSHQKEISASFSLPPAGDTTHPSQRKMEEATRSVDDGQNSVPAAVAKQVQIFLEDLRGCVRARVCTCVRRCVRVCVCRVCGHVVYYTGLCGCATSEHTRPSWSQRCAVATYA